MNATKRCPFCGGKALVRYIMPCSCVQCQKCGAATGIYSDLYEQTDSREKAIEAWNGRVDYDTERTIG